MDGEAALLIRPAAPSDLPEIVALMRDLADYQGVGHLVSIDEELLRAELFRTEPAARCIAAERDSGLVAFALYCFNFSSWTGRRGLYLEDLYVRPEERGRGTGKALMHWLARLAVSSGCARFEWRVLDWNEPAIAFYAGLGARPQEGSTLYRIDGDALHHLSGV